MILKTRHILAVGLALLALTGYMSKLSVNNAIEDVNTTIDLHNEYKAMSDDEKRYLLDFCNGSTMDDWEEVEATGKCTIVFDDYLNEK